MGFTGHHESIGALSEDSLELCNGCQENIVPYVSARMDELKEQRRGISETAFIPLTLSNPQSDSSEVEQWGNLTPQGSALTHSENNLHHFSLLSLRHSKNGTSEVL